ncbi:hypothetical protein HELRODRAFT_145252, partial [Helobdella robusta]|uniref:Fibrinogen C-terminal domain-containing protein n=1 Tax=Helobdella robusta TaxID=6412 RepID=T1EJJ7_HELRO
VVQQRLDNSLSFDRKWASYKAGFGSYDSNFWFGLEKIYQLTNSGNYRLRFEVLGIGIWFSDEYDSFLIDSDSNDYTIHVSGYSGDNLNILNQPKLLGSTTYQNGQPFSTTDRDSSCGCPGMNNGGYWLNCCFAQNLNADHKG